MPQIVIDRLHPVLWIATFDHLHHQAPGERLQILIVRAVFGADDDAELVTVLPGVVEPGVTIDLVDIGAVELASTAIACGAITLDIAQMGLGDDEPLAAERDRPISTMTRRWRNAA